MKITFKNVGQGDSILLEWIDNDRKKIGIIDCRKKGKSNPILDHIITENYTEIEFIVLSHPHTDHYSGMNELLTKVMERKITINTFKHTLDSIGSQYWKWFEFDDKDSYLFRKVVDIANDLYEMGLIKNFSYPRVDSYYRLTQDNSMHLICLSPGHDELNEYQRIVEYNPIENKTEASSAANLLSTVFCLNVNGTHVLLTADAESQTFDRIIDRHLHLIKNRIFHLCQVPHHGSENNYNERFWTEIDKADKRFSVISAGENEKYKHPSLLVVSGLKEEFGFDVKCTNNVYGYKEYFDLIRTKSLALDMESEIAEEYIEGGDKVYLYNGIEFELEEPKK